MPVCFLFWRLLTPRLPQLARRISNSIFRGVSSTSCSSFFFIELLYLSACVFWAQLAAVEPFPSILSCAQLEKGHSVRQAPSRVSRREIDSTPTRGGTQCTTKAPGVARPASFTHSQFDKFSLRHWVSLAHRHLPLEIYACGIALPASNV